MEGQKQLSGKYRRTGKEWSDEVKGRGLNPAQQAYIDSLPRVDSKSAQNSEVLAELRENNAFTASKNKLPDSDWMKQNERLRWGTVMHHLTFLKKLRDAGVRCWYNEKPFEGIIGLRAVRKGYEQLGIQFVCGVKMGWTTEFDIFWYDRYGVELNRKYIGWRSVVPQLIVKGILTEREANKIFGAPSLSEASTIYRRTLHQIRNSRGYVS